MYGSQSRASDSLPPQVSTRLATPSPTAGMNGTAYQLDGTHSGCFATDPVDWRNWSLGFPARIRENASDLCPSRRAAELEVVGLEGPWSRARLSLMSGGLLQEP